jgi:hypothetical protein
MTWMVNDCKTLATPWQPLGYNFANPTCNQLHTGSCLVKWDRNPSHTPRPDVACRRLVQRMHPKDDAVLALAGLYEFWLDKSKAEDDADRWLTTFLLVGFMRR